jgi:transcriptional regulator with XRE-family HTH domain
MAKRETGPTLDTFLAARGSAKRLAKKLRMSMSHLSDIRHRKRSPSLSVALAISRETGVPVESLMRRAA